MRERLASFVQSTELFRSAGPAAVEELITDLRVIELADGQALVSQGDHNPNLYLLMSGRLLVTAHNLRNEPRLLLAVSPGESANESSILSDDSASATILSAGESTVLAVPRAIFESFSAKYPTDALQVMEALSGRLQRCHLSLSLHLNKLFDNLEADVLRDLDEELEMFTLYGGEVLFRQGDPGDFLCLVVRGRVRVRVRDGSGGDTTVAELGSGEIVGEMGVVTGESRTSTVDAIRDSQLAKLTRAGFERFMTKHPSAVAQTFSRKLAERLQDTAAGSARRSRGIACVAVVPAHAGAPLSQFCAGLRQVLERFGRTVHLSGTLVDRHLGREGIAQTYERGGNNIRVVEWLSELEIASDYLLYEADPFLSPWTERCVRQADHVLVVGDAKADPALGEIEAELLSSRDARDRSRAWLVLVHGEENPSGTKSWLDARTVERHFHVRLGQSEGFERVVRFLTGRAVGLTLGGGFARSLAHAGVYRAFADTGIAVDAIGGASMGALVGALLAMDWNAEKIVREVSAGFTNPYFADLTFPFIAFKTGKMLSKLVQRLFGDTQIEDLWIPYFCVSANLNRSELKIHDRGPLARAVLATTRAPGLFPPVVYDGELHVDGGVINNVPVDIMKAFSNDGITVGVDVSPPHELHPIHDYGDNVSGWKACWQRLSPFVKHKIYTPSILLVMIRTLEYTGVSYKGSRLKYADLYMYPEMLKFKRSDFDRASEILDAGYECARTNLLEWLSQPSTVARRPDLAGIVAGYKGDAAETADSLLADAG
jgi:lysophospholipid hydrolase